MTNRRQRVSSGAPWEKRCGYVRAVRAGDFVAVAGTTAVGDDGRLVAPNDAYAQTGRCIEIVAAALEEAGGSLDDVVRTRIFLTHIEDWEAAGRAHAEAFGQRPPASTMLAVQRLIDPAMRVEIEADAVLESRDTKP